MLPGVEADTIRFLKKNAITTTKQKPIKKAVVIGAGIGGIASAIRLAAKGYEVDIYEKNNYPGGKLTEIKQDGYRFDAGPSLFTLPHLVTELFELCGENPNQHFSYSKLDVLCNYFHYDGTSYSTFSDINKTANSISSVTGEDENQIKEFISDNKDLYDLTSDIFIENSLNDHRNYLRFSFFIKLFKLGKLKMNQTMFQSLQKYFKTDKVIQHFSRYATYNGSNPYQAPATLNVISSLEYSMGAYLPDKGMHEITDSLVKLASRNGVIFHYNTPVSKILHNNKKVIGIAVDDKVYPYDIVISNSDIHYVYNRLLDGIKKPEKILSQERSSSVLVFNWGIKKTFPQLDLHNIVFSDNYEDEFLKIFEEKKIGNDSTIYIFISSKMVSEDAPSGCENWFVLVNAPSTSEIDWEETTQRCKKEILQKLSQILGENIAPYIETEYILDPPAIEKLTGSYQGALYGNSSNNKMSAFLRHPNKSNQLKNLYFVGGSVHPGGGIPLCLSSAKIVDKWIQRAQ